MLPYGDTMLQCILIVHSPQLVIHLRQRCIELALSGNMAHLQQFTRDLYIYTMAVPLKFQNE